ncbi:MAG: hypothetical protein JNK87_42345 [Bryobacterales bacterium]|nr:hypothetical protein [Bryobacterales bacterium]
MNGTVANSTLPSPSPEVVRRVLDQVLVSEPFRNSHRMQRFLRFVVDRTLDNSVDELKESVVGVTVFDRRADYDPKTDSIVRVQARQLRGKLSEYYAGPGSHDVIRFEIPKGSYAPVIRTFDPEPQRADIDTPAPPSPTSADLAVLPFVNLSSDPEIDYFSDGISEEILTQLAHVRGLRLIARTSSFQFKGKNRDVREISQALGCRAVLEGSVRRAGSMVRITAQLIEGSGGTHLWAGTFDACLADPAQVFAIQEDIAIEISRRTGRMVTSVAPVTPSMPASVAAYDLYLRGRKLLREYRPEAVQAAIAVFEKALAEDPGYTAAYAAIGHAYGHLGVYGGPAGAGALHKARHYALETLRRDPNSADGHALLGSVSAALDVDLAGAEQHYGRALAIDPQHAHTRQARALWLLAPAGRGEQAIAELRELMALDPLSLDLRHTLLTVLYLAGRFTEAIEEATLILRFMPELHSVLFFRMAALDAVGETERALEDLRRQAETMTALPIRQHYEACVLLRDGRLEDAKSAAERLEQDPRSPFAPTVPADLWLRLGELDRAMDWLERAYETKFFRVAWIGADASYRKLHGHPRFEALRAKLLAGVSWRAAGGSL